MNALKLIEIFLLLIILHTGLISQTILEPAMVFVKGGSFVMGSNDSEATNDEKPTHTVSLSDFSISKYEVTVAEYKAFCTATSRTMPDAPSWGWNDKHPIVYVNYNDAVSYCNWLGETLNKNYRLPTESEWEYAARGGQMSKRFTYAGSNDLDEVAWYDDNAGGQTNTVGRKKANELGIHDMSGNVWEWCRDWYGDYTPGAKTNPRGPSSGRCRVDRGGGWDSTARSCRVSDRGYNSSGERNRSMGFRVVASE